MTSSLVGSEMCIRDSLFTCRNRLARSPPWWNDQEDEEEAAARISPSKSCLLYTSDAADECSV
eukprot:10245167-Prorocentrum_lima.AAC.1